MDKVSTFIKEASLLDSETVSLYACRLARLLPIVFISWIFCLFALLDPAGAQSPLAGNYGKSESTTEEVDSNPVSAFDIRANYFKRFPFARRAFELDKKSLVERGVLENQGNQSFMDGAFGGGSPEWLSSVLGGDEIGKASGGPTRLQRSDPPEAPRVVTAYPPFVKFCNDNPFQGICYWQAGVARNMPATNRDMELFENTLTTFGYPVSDTQFQLIQRENFQRLLELLYDPERAMWAALGVAGMQAASAANSLAGVAEQAFNQCIDYILNGHSGTGTLINVANDGVPVDTSSGGAGSHNLLYKPVSVAVWMVQQMYKGVFIPMALLFLLPGAVISQVKAVVRHGMFIESATSPFEGILRAVIAIFLIPGTQLIVSYSIDVGNSMAFSVKDWVDESLLKDWCHELSYNVNPENHKNVISPPDANLPPSALEARTSGTATMSGSGGKSAERSGGGAFAGSIGNLLSSVPGVGGFLKSLFGLLTQAYDGMFGSGGDGLGANVPESLTVQEDQLALSGVMQALFNGTVYMVSLSIIILTAYQLIFMCYLYLMGPIAAALYAWPDVNQSGSSSKFRGVFSNWLDAVVCLSLWRFYWMLGLAIMTARLQYIGGGHLGTNDLQWEVIVFVTMLALMLWTATNPFVYDPGRAAEGVEKIHEKGQSSGGGGGSSPAGGSGPSGIGSSVAGPSSPVSGGASSAVSNATTNNVSMSPSINSGMTAGITEGTGAQGRGFERGGMSSSSNSATNELSAPPLMESRAQGSSISTAVPGASPPPSAGGGSIVDNNTGMSGAANAAQESGPPPSTSSGSGNQSSGSAGADMHNLAGTFGIGHSEPMGSPLDAGAPLPLEPGAGVSAHYNPAAIEHVGPALAAGSGRANISKGSESSSAQSGSGAGSTNKSDTGFEQSSKSQMEEPAYPPPPSANDQGGSGDA